MGPPENMLQAPTAIETVWKTHAAELTVNILKMVLQAYRSSWNEKFASFFL